MWTPLILAQNLLPELNKFKLDIVAEHLDLPSFNHHRASDDAGMVGYMLILFFEKMRRGAGHQSPGRRSTANARAAGPWANKNHRRPKHIIILAKNKLGLKHLYQLVSAFKTTDEMLWRNFPTWEREPPMIAVVKNPPDDRGPGGGN